MDFKLWIRLISEFSFSLLQQVVSLNIIGKYYTATNTIKRDKKAVKRIELISH